MESTINTLIDRIRASAPEGELDVLDTRIDSWKAPLLVDDVSSVVALVAWHDSREAPSCEMEMLQLWWEKIALRCERLERNNVMLSDGFYAGAGALLWVNGAVTSLYREPGTVPTIRNRVFHDEPKRSSRDIAAVSCGLAGNLLGCLCRPDPDRDVVRRLIERLLGSAKMSDAGLWWDRFEHACSIPLGFVNGSAGVDYAIALGSAYLDVDLSPVILASIAHSNAEADLYNNRWPDYERSASRVYHDGSDSVGSVALKARCAIDDSACWSTGVAGILLSRAAVLATTDNESLRDVCLADCDKAATRLDEFFDQSGFGEDLTVCNGLSGVLLVLHACQDIYAPAGALLAKVRAKAERAIAHHQADLRLNDRTFLNGMSGIAYALIVCRRPLPIDNLVAPGLQGILATLRKRRAQSRGSVSHAGVDFIKHLYCDRLQKLHAIPDFKSEAMKLLPLNLPSVVHLARNLMTRDTLPEVRAAVDHEIALARCMATQTDNSALFVAEQRNDAIYRAHLAKAEMNSWLFATLQLAPVVELFVVPFVSNPSTREVTNGKSFLVRVSKAAGIIEQQTSSLVFNVLSEFRTPQRALVAIDRVCSRVKIPDNQKANAARLCLAYIQQMTGDGLLLYKKNGDMAALLRAGKFSKIKRRLFPSKLA